MQVGNPRARDHLSNLPSSSFFFPPWEGCKGVYVRDWVIISIGNKDTISFYKINELRFLESHQCSFQVGKHLSRVKITLLFTAQHISLAGYCREYRRHLGGATQIKELTVYLGRLNYWNKERITSMKLCGADTSCSKNRDISGLESRRWDTSWLYRCIVFGLREGTHGDGHMNKSPRWHE